MNPFLRLDHCLRLPAGSCYPVELPNDVSLLWLHMIVSVSQTQVLFARPCFLVAAVEQDGKADSLPKTCSSHESETWQVQMIQPSHRFSGKTNLKHLTFFLPQITLLPHLCHSRQSTLFSLAARLRLKRALPCGTGASGSSRTLPPGGSAIPRSSIP